MGPPILDYGLQPPANAFLPPEAPPPPRLPLSVVLCPTCGLAQVPEVVDPRLLFGAYAYATGTSATMTAHLRDLARHLADAAGRGARVLEIASNDGTLLDALQAAGLRPTGVDPAANLSAGARGRGHDVLTAFFDAAVADELAQTRGPFAAVVATNVLAHVDDPVALLAAAGRLAPRVVVEVPSLGALVGRLAWDTVYHEHLCVFSVPVLVEAFQRAGLGVVEVEDLAVHGGSLRVTGVPGAPTASAVLRRAEHDRPLTTWGGLAPSARAFSQAVLDLVDAVRTQPPGSVAAYGAAAKGTVLFNLGGLGPGDVAWIADQNPMKTGTLQPGTAIPVVPAGRVHRDRPPVLVLIPWNLEAEVRAWLGPWAGELWVPLPTLRRDRLG